MSKKIVLVVGAGASVADVGALSQKKRPPLDKGFFRIAQKTDSGYTKKVVAYMRMNYGLDILAPQHDSLETVMSMIYTDTFNPLWTDVASDAFRALISLFNRRLASTTNSLQITQQHRLYRILAHYLNCGVKPNDITIITFNQDIQIEKTLARLETRERLARFGKLLNFPFCYSIPCTRKNITAPKDGKNLFPLGDPKLHGVVVLKLHGSLNWYSVHRSPNPSPTAMFNVERRLYVTRRRTIKPQMHYIGASRKQYTLPVVVPPLTHKSATLHRLVKSLWAIAEVAFRKANAIVIFGYSCPAVDHASCNLFRRSLIGRATLEDVVIIDPDPNVVVRYSTLIEPKKVHYYPDARYFLESLPN